MPTTIETYIAFRRENGQTPQAVYRFADMLKRADIASDMDPGKLQNDDEWRKNTRKRISKTDVMCLMIGPTTADSDWINDEILWAHEMRVPVLPIVIDEKLTDTTTQLQRLKLSTSQYLLFNETDNQNIRILSSIRDVAEVMGRDKRKRPIVINRSTSLPNYADRTVPSGNPILNHYRLEADRFEEPLEVGSSG